MNTGRSAERAALAGVAFAMAIACATPATMAAGRAPYGGHLRVPVSPSFGLAITDPHQAQSVSQRLAAGLTHCRLFATDRAGRVVNELVSHRQLRDRKLLLTLAKGATFHNGAPITATDVVESLKRVRELGGASAPSPLVSQLTVTALPDGRVSVAMKSGMKASVVGALLARAEVAVLQQGAPGVGHGCGAFRVSSLTGKGAVLTAFAGHPVGRPRVDKVTLSVVASATAQVERFVFNRTDLSFEASHRYPRGTQAASVNRFSTIFALPHPRWKQGQDPKVRQVVWGALTQQSLARFLPWDTTPARSPWPDHLAPTARRLAVPAKLPSSLVVGPLVIAYPTGNLALKDLARVARDRLRSYVLGGVRIMGVTGLTVSAATLDSSIAAAASAAPSWHIAVTPHDWAATDVAQAAWEAASALGADGLDASVALAGRSRRWADRIIGRYTLMPLVHVRRPVFHRGHYRLVPSAGAIRFDESYRRP